MEATVYVETSIISRLTDHLKTGGTQWPQAELDALEAIVTAPTVPPCHVLKDTRRNTEDGIARAENGAPRSL